MISMKRKALVNSVLFPSLRALCGDGTNSLHEAAPNPPSMTGLVEPQLPEYSRLARQAASLLRSTLSTGHGPGHSSVLEVCRVELEGRSAGRPWEKSGFALFSRLRPVSLLRACLETLRCPVSAKALRTAALLAVGGVGSALTAHHGDAPASPPCPPPKCLAAGPLGVSGQALRLSSTPRASREPGSTDGWRSMGRVGCMLFGCERLPATSPGSRPTWSDCPTDRSA
jgi:hypothetical protein